MNPKVWRNDQEIIGHVKENKRITFNNKEIRLAFEKHLVFDSITNTHILGSKNGINIHVKVLHQYEIGDLVGIGFENLKNINELDYTKAQQNCSFGTVASDEQTIIQ